MAGAASVAVPTGGTNADVSQPHPCFGREDIGDRKLQDGLQPPKPHLYFHVAADLRKPSGLELSLNPEPLSRVNRAGCAWLVLQQNGI
jgi:hypothetical protein